MNQIVMHLFDYHCFGTKFVLNHKTQSKELKTDNTESLKTQITYSIKMNKVLNW